MKKIKIAVLALAIICFLFIGIYAVKESLSKRDSNKEDIAKEDISKEGITKEDVAKEDTAKEDIAKEDIAEEDKAEEVINPEVKTEIVLPVLDLKNRSIFPREADYSFLSGVLVRLPKEDEVFGYDIRSADLTKVTLANDYDKLIRSSFDSKTIWPEDMPEEFHPEDVMELYKNPGLDARKLHEMGITGKGIGIAIIDQPLLVDHVEYSANLKYYAERATVKGQDAQMHGSAVASIAVGKTVGVAPEADLYYISDDFKEIYETSHDLLADSIVQLLNLNKTLPYDNRIRVISISWGADRDSKTEDTKLKAAYQRAKEEGVLVLTTSLSIREDMEFFGLDRMPLSNPDDFSSYTDILYGSPDISYNISVPMNYRCTASPTGTNDYVVYKVGGKSWATPYVAGLYVLACQVKPEITYEEFWKIAAETSRTNKIEDGNQSYEAKYIADPVAIINRIKEQVD
jgi:subtilisin family serine protease